VKICGRLTVWGFAARHLLAKLAELEIWSRAGGSSEGWRVVFCCGVQRRWKLPRSLLELSLQSLIYSVPGLRVGKVTGTTNESGANHNWANALCHPMSLGRFGKMIANGFPSVRSHDPAVVASAPTSGTLGRLAAAESGDTDSSR